MPRDKKPTLKDILSDAKTGNKLKKAKWDLYKDGLTQTMIGKFLGCRERFRLGTVEAWTAKGMSVPLEFGNIFHDLLEAFYANKTSKQLQSLIRNYIITKQKNSTASNHDIEMLAYTVLTTFLNYCVHWRKTPTYQVDGRDYFDSDFVWLGQEEVFKVDHFLPERNVTIKLNGRWDGVFRHPVTNKIALLENKTKGKVNEQALLLGLQEDLQCMLYCYTLQKHYGEVPQHILYNIIRRPQLRPRVKDTVRDYCQRVDEDQQKRPDFYFMRHDVDLSPGHVDAFVVNQLNPILVQIVDWWESIKHDPFNPWVDENGERNVLHFQRPMGVYDSEMYNEKGDLPEIVLEGDFNGYYQRQHIFPELVD